MPNNILVEVSSHERKAHALHREIGSASTWSLERLDALAAEATALFRMRCLMGPTPVQPRDPPPPLEPKPRRRNASSHPRTSSPESAHINGLVQPVGGFADTSKPHIDEEQQQSMEGERGSIPKSHGSTACSPSGQSNLVGGKGPTGRRGRRQKEGRQGVQRRADEAEPSCSKEEQQQRRQELQHRQRHGRVRGARSPVCDYPVQALAAVNDVLFERHGYRRMTRHGDPRCDLLCGRAHIRDTPNLQPELSLKVHWAAYCKVAERML